MLFSSILLSLAFGRAFADAGDDDDLMTFVTVCKTAAPEPRLLTFAASQSTSFEV